MNYKETLDYLFTRLPMFSRTGAAAIKPDLYNTLEICRYLDDPQAAFKTIHVAGTNGKGSVSHMLAAVLQASGYKTGLYTSPHLKDFRERIKINGEMIDENTVVQFTEQMIPLINAIQPSFFEITVGMAFSYFAKKQVDVAVVETGLGGRLDSTNIITPELSVITNIGMDHTNLLGNTLPQIASEKAGIIKKGIPVVVGESSAETDAVFIETARQKNAPIHFADKIRYAAGWRHTANLLEAEIRAYQNPDQCVRYRLDLQGDYQLKNLTTALEAIAQLQRRGWELPAEKVHAALQQVKKMTGLHGRWELVGRRPDIVLDVGHNEDGIRQVVTQLEHCEYQALHIVMGMVKDKDIDKVLRLLPKDARYYFTRAQIPRALPEEALYHKALQAGLKGDHYPEVNIALQAAIRHAGKKDMILVCGSVFIVGEVNL